MFFLIGFIRITVVSVAKDAHFVEDLKTKEIKYKSVLAIKGECIVRSDRT